MSTTAVTHDATTDRYAVWLVKSWRESDAPDQPFGTIEVARGTSEKEIEAEAVEFVNEYSADVADCFISEGRKTCFLHAVIQDDDGMEVARYRFKFDPKVKLSAL